ncbi:MAG: HAD family hydrolase [Bacteroidales bacterium]|nr:HAD family hydrolase [Bacteroidales bacterium]
MMNQYRYTHVIWDWNGTLLDDAWLCVAVMNGMLRERDLPTRTLRQYKEVFDFPVRDYYEKLGYDFSSEPFEEVGLEFMVLYNRRQHEARLHTGVIDILSWLRDRGIRQSILSAREQSELIDEISAAGISPFFDHIYGLEDHYAHGKTEVGFRLINDIHVPKDQILFIGDTKHDAEVAREVGIDCLLMPNGHHSRKRLELTGIPIVKQFEDLKERLYRRQPD